MCMLVSEQIHLQLCSKVVEEVKWNRRSYVVLLYGGTEEGKPLCSIVVEEWKWNRRSNVVLLYGGTEEGNRYEVWL